MLFSGMADGSGNFTIPVNIVAGSNVLVVTATTSSGATAQTTRSLVNDVVNGTLLFDTADPTSDDNGPGNYAYPTASDFHAGAYDIERFQVYDTGTSVTFRVQTRDLSPTFGSDIGAQLVDVYVHDPSASPTSTAASFPQRNYTIAPADAWSRLIEVQGFGQRFVDANGTTVGTVNGIKGNAISRYITFSVDKSALGGTPTSGWAFTVTRFGVCAAASNDPHCTFDPNAVPKVMDTITPSGVNQSTELDYTLKPVVLQGVAMP
jgi:hypothetical protein